MKIQFAPLQQEIEKASQFIKALGYTAKPRLALIFGSGLGNIADSLKVKLEVPYSDIPGFPTATVSNHKGSLIMGRIGNEDVIAMNGRVHFYEGYSMRDITLPVRVMQELGAEILIVTNISGGVNPEYKLGDLVVITDHINMLWDNPLIGPNDENIGERYTDLREPYSCRLIEAAVTQAMKSGIDLHRGVYMAMTGPTYETPAEMRMVRKLGADVVGMSTVPEVLAAAHGGMEVLGLSMVSNQNFPECLKPIDQDTLMKTAAKGAKMMYEVVEGLILNQLLSR